MQTRARSSHNYGNARVTSPKVSIVTRVLLDHSKGFIRVRLVRTHTHTHVYIYIYMRGLRTRPDLVEISSYNSQCIQHVPRMDRWRPPQAVMKYQREGKGTPDDHEKDFWVVILRAERAKSLESLKA
jgi:hypothetical protein